MLVVALNIISNKKVKSWNRPKKAPPVMTLGSDTAQVVIFSPAELSWAFLSFTITFYLSSK